VFGSRRNDSNAVDGYNRYVAAGTDAQEGMFFCRSTPCVRSRKVAA
jgi:hypothetical protein